VKFAVNLDRCESYGICAHTSPEQFELDDDSNLVFRQEAESEYVSPDLSEEEVRGARLAADMCPLQAIRMMP
jgi:ferredoxin